MTAAAKSFPDLQLARDGRLLAAVRRNAKPVAVRIERPRSEFPELIVTVPDAWKEIILAPLYDVHIGNSSMMQHYSPGMSAGSLTIRTC